MKQKNKVVFWVVLALIATTTFSYSSETSLFRPEPKWMFIHNDEGEIDRNSFVDDGPYLLSENEAKTETESPPVEKDQPKEESQPKRFTIDEVVVSATRYPMSIEDAPSSISVVDTETIENAPINTPDDMLRQVAGIDVWGNNVADIGFRSVNLRGLNGGNTQERTLILVDGVPLNDTWAGWVAWNQAPIEDVERIEVVRGPSSSLYGSNAMGGVINMITRLPSEAPLEFRGQGRYGEFNTWKLYGNASGTLLDGNLGYYFSGKGSASDGYFAIPEDRGPNRSKNEYQLENGNGKLFWNIDEYSHLKVDASHYHEDRNRGFEFSNIERSISKGNLSYQRNVPGGNNWLFTLYGSDEDQEVDHDDRITHDSVLYTSKSEKPFYGSIFQFSFPAPAWNTISLGAEYRHSKVTMTDTFQQVDRVSFTEGKQQYLGIYAQDNAHLLEDSLVLSIGARYDWWRSYDGRTSDTDPPLFDPFDQTFDSEKWGKLNPKVGAVYHIGENTSLRGSVGTGYRAPNPSELYANLTFGPTLIQGNPELDPEQIISYEGGISHSFNNRLKGRLTAYYSIVEDLISTRTVDKSKPFGPFGPTLTTKIQDNINEVVPRGVEFEVSYLLSKSWQGFLNYTYNRSEIVKDSDPSIEGNDLANSPRHKFNFNITYDQPEFFTGTFLARYVSEQFNDNENTEKLSSYWSLDVKLSKTFANYFNVYFQIENLLDEEYEIPTFGDTFLAPGRIWEFGLNVTI